MELCYLKFSNFRFCVFFSETSIHFEDSGTQTNQDFMFHVGVLNAANVYLAWLIEELITIILICAWKAKCPIFKAILAGFRGKVALKNRALGFPGVSLFLPTCWLLRNFSTKRKKTVFFLSESLDPSNSKSV